MTVAVLSRAFCIPQRHFVGSCPASRPAAYWDTLFVLVLIAALLAGLARRDVSLDERSAAISRPMLTPRQGSLK